MGKKVNIQNLSKNKNSDEFHILNSYFKKYILASSMVLFLSIMELASQNLFPDNGIVFQDNILPRIDVIIPADSLALILAPGNESSNYEFHCTFLFSDGVYSDTLTDVGFRLRGNTSRNAFKKSYKVSFNTYKPGRKWQNLEKLNLNGEHNDPSISRGKICWDILRKLEISAPRANHVDFYINGNYFGVYLNVENIDEQFTKLRFGNNAGNLYKCLYPADLVYKGEDQEDYKIEVFGRRPYELQNNQIADDYSDLKTLIGVLNNTPVIDLPCKLESLLEVDNVIRLIVFDILSGNWDGPVYNKNNFYLYKNQKSGKFEMIPFDLDNTLGIDFLNVDWTKKNIYSWKPSNENRPLYTKILAVPEYKNRFSFYFHRAINTFFNEDTMLPILDSLKEKLENSAQKDPYRPLDYGFTFNDFKQSFKVPLPYNHTPEGILSYITKRQSSVNQQLQLNKVKPIIQNKIVKANSNSNYMTVTSKVIDDSGVGNVEFCYKINQGIESCVSLFDDGMHSDLAANDHVFGLQLEIPINSKSIIYRIKATDSEKNESFSPLCDFDTLMLYNTSSDLVINEVMTDNSSTILDENGEYDDWIEIYNRSDQEVNLDGYYLTDKKGIKDKWSMPNTILPAYSYLLVWADDDVTQGQFHTNFKLEKNGEYLGLFQKTNDSLYLKDEVLIPGILTDTSYGRYPNGYGSFQFLNPTPLSSNSPLSALNHINYNVTSPYTIFPNPANEYFSIQNLGSIASINQVEIFNVYGICVMNYTLPLSDKTIIDTSNIPNGIYYARISKNATPLETLKIVIQHF